MSTQMSLWQRYQALKTNQPKLRMRDAAEVLAVSECELVAADPASTALRPEWPALLGQLATLGPVMALTRNHACVHETTGEYANVSFEGPVGLALNPIIDLRIFVMHWRYGYAVKNLAGPRGPQYSLQFFDRQGEAVHKVYLTEHSNVAQFEALCEQFAQTEASEPTIDREPAPVKADPSDSSIDQTAFQSEWMSLKDVHEFHPFLRRWGVGRQQAFRLAPQGQAWQVAPQAVEQLLRRASHIQAPIMVFAGNRGMIQIHTGIVNNIQIVGDWLNVLDPAFNLHLRTDLIAEAWVTRKPGDCGVVTSLELFDEEGVSLATFFGERKPGQPERVDWLKLLGELPVLESAHVA